MESFSGGYLPGHAKETHDVAIDPGELLLRAAKVGNEALTRKLISRGVPVNVRDQFGCEPIYYAARHNHLNILKILVESNASTDSTTLMNRTALQIAAYHGNIGCVQYLLRKQANINATDDLGMSALHWAAENNHKNTVELLLKSGADYTLVNKFGKSAQILARIKNNTKIFELLEDNRVSDQFQKDYPDSMFLSQPNIIDSTILKDRLMKSKFKDIAMATKGDTIKLFEQHGIKLLPVDESTLIASALSRGKTAVLTEAGKLALKKTEPNFVYNLVRPNSSNPFVQLSSRMMKREKSNRLPQNFESASSETITSKPKIVRTDTTSFTNFTGNKNMVVHSSKPKILRTDTTSFANSARNKNMVVDSITKSENSNDESLWLRRNTTMVYGDDYRGENFVTKYRESQKRLKFLEDQLLHKSQTVNKLRRQLEASETLTKCYKSKYEIKEREASLYKVQLQNILETLAKKNIKRKKGS